MHLWAELVKASWLEIGSSDRWSGLIGAIAQFLHQTAPTAGMICSHSWIISKNHHLQLHYWTFTNHPAPLSLPTCLPAPEVVRLPHPPTPFLLILTPTYGIVLCLSPDETQCLWSWHPQPLHIAINYLRAHIAHPDQQAKFLSHAQFWGDRPPSYTLMSLFQAICLDQTPLPAPLLPDLQPIPAIAHEVKTTLATILTLTRSLQKKTELNPSIHDRLSLIAQECLEQNQRFELLLQAAHLQSTTRPDRQPIALDRLLHNLLHQWQAQVQHRQISIQLQAQPPLAPILSNQYLLAQVLNGIIDRLSRSYPQHSHIYLHLSQVGSHLKCQFQVQTSQTIAPPQTIGEWYSLQTETGALSLSLATAKAIVELLGGRLTTRTQQTLTLFLPIAPDHP